MSLWHTLKHPCVWFTEKDLPRLRENAQSDFWRPKFDAWRTELAGVERLPLPNRPIDFHRGDNEQALKAAGKMRRTVCAVRVDSGNDHIR